MDPAKSDREASLFARRINQAKEEVGVVNKPIPGSSKLILQLPMPYSASCS
jgi:hypothetical protein